MHRLFEDKIPGAPYYGYYDHGMIKGKEDKDNNIYSFILICDAYMIECVYNLNINDFTERDRNHRIPFVTERDDSQI